jgi:hypothetical protein
MKRIHYLLLKHFSKNSVFKFYGKVNGWGEWENASDPALPPMLTGNINKNVNKLKQMGFIRIREKTRMGKHYYIEAELTQKGEEELALHTLEEL